VAAETDRAVMEKTVPVAAVAVQTHQTAVIEELEMAETEL